jgi:predicted dehydrogenase
MDPRRDRLDEAGEMVEITDGYTSLADISKSWNDIDAVVVASPPAFHVSQTVACLEAGKPVLLEKPVCAEISEAEILLRTHKSHADVPLLLGYTYRWWPPLRDFKEQLAEGKVGKPLHARFVMSAHLADWHPWERYQEFFMASKDLGGGALLDESHFVDLMIWFFGMPAAVWSRVEKLSELEIDTDDNVDMIAIYDDGLRVNIHLDLYGRPHEKYISIVGEGCTLAWSFEPNRYRYSDRIEQNWREIEYRLERNDMFVDLAREFVSIIEDPRNQPSCGLEDGMRVLEVLEACRRSSRTGCIADLSQR